jgi:hypothetical protein
LSIKVGVGLAASAAAVAASKFNLPKGAVTASAPVVGVTVERAEVVSPLVKNCGDLKFFNNLGSLNL